MSDDVVRRAAGRAARMLDADARGATPVEAMLAHAFALVAVSEAVACASEDPDPAGVAALAVLGAVLELGGRLPVRDGLGYAERFIWHLAAHAVRAGIIHSLHVEAEDGHDNADDLRAWATGTGAAVVVEEGAQE